MSDYRAQVILRTADNIPANYVTNSFSFQVVPDANADTDEFTVCIKDFYDDIVSYLSPLIATTGHMVKYYELPGLVPNYPFEEDLWDLTVAPSGTTLPSEVSVVLSFQGIRQAGFPQARRRGRVYLGPLDSTGNDVGRPSATMAGVIATAGATLKSNIEAITGGNHSWTVWSVADQAGVPVDNGWVDNAWDTQRRRGLATTSRTTFI